MPPLQKQKSLAAQREEEILSFWNKHNIFKKALEKKSPKGNFVFYDGPPFATGLPHYGHLLASIIKDAIPRYKTMRGYHVRRQWGWDCHGLPIENLIEEELGLEKKKDIERFGIEEFNRAAQNSVLRYYSEWKKIIPRVGRWVDMEGGYKTMDASYTESIWWAFKTLYDKKLVYEGYKSMHICPRCETTLAASEVSMGYKDITDISIIVKFQLESLVGSLSSSNRTDPVGSPSGSNGAGEKVYLLVWTTTPWTLPGNVALAINKRFTYVKIALSQKVSDNKERYIIAKERLGILKTEYEIIDEFKGSDLIGEKYTPLFNYYADALVLKNRDKGWKVYPAGFVNAKEGTGIVHIAPAFGEDDMELGKIYNLPFIQHISFGGIFKQEVEDFRGLAVKPKHDHQATDNEIIKHLEHRGLLFAREKITHAYPFCWRCDTPLLNYAASSWFVKVTALKRKLLEVNKKITWVPGSMKYGRFGNWLLGARDWAVSRLRFWGAPIPVWKCEACKKTEVIGSIDEIKQKTYSSGNTYTVMRHGEAESNRSGLVNSAIDEKNTLTEKGANDVLKTARALKDKHIDIIFSSPLPRARQTASIVAETIGTPVLDIIIDERLREISVGDFEGKSINAYHAYFSSTKERFTKRPEGGENVLDVKKRVGDFLESIDSRFTQKNILIVTHEYTIWQLYAVAFGWTVDESVRVKKMKNDFVETAQTISFSYSAIPRNAEYETDLHRPFIDRILFPCSCGGVMKRIPEVFDCWFESGSMPFAQFHYPFKNKKVFKKNFPAHFIAEGLDQTRGWFFTMLVLSVGLFGKTAYSTVIVNGLILAEDGQKMSKRLKNYPDPVAIINTYGADALRYHLLSSPVMRGESINFSEKDVREVLNKVVARTRNVLAFYKLYCNINPQSAVHPPALMLRRVGNSQPTAYNPQSGSTNVLDRWVLVRLTELINKVTYATEAYELDRATRPIAEFVDDLSTWYIRRSRERFKNGAHDDAQSALATTQFVLTEFSKIIAPFMPFIADEIYCAVRTSDRAESVHLTEWPRAEPALPVWPNPMALLHRLFGTHEELRLLSLMARVREIVSLALEARQKHGIKVRQPLKELRIRKQEVRIRNNKQMIDLIKDEINVKEIIFGAPIEDEVELDTALTHELKEEGKLRELVRQIQDLRKNKELLPTQKINVVIATDNAGKKFITAFEQELKRAASLAEISFGDATGKKISVDGLLFVIELKK